MNQLEEEQLIDELRRLTRMVEKATDGVDFSLPPHPPQSPLLQDLYQQLVKLVQAHEHQQKIDSSQRAFFQRIFDELPVEVVIFDQDLRYRYINPVAVKDDEVRQWMIGRTDADYCRFRNMSEEFLQQRMELHARVVKTGEAYSIYQASEDRDGNVRHYVRQLFPVFMPSGDLEMLIGYGLEVTEIKHKEAELEKKNAELEKTNAELDQFVYRTSHDLRSPVVSILGLLNLMELEDVPPSLQRYIEMIRSRAFKLDGVIRDIVNFSRISRQEIQVEAVDPGELLEQALEDIPEHVRTPQVEITHEVDAQAHWFADSFRTHLLLSNLISNALKFQDPARLENGFVKVRVKVQDQEAVIEIEDNGIGIPEDQQPHIFDLFFRGTHQGGGSGIGLYIVREVLERIGGRIEVDSHEGIGTRFSIFLPNLQPEPLSPNLTPG